MARNSTWPARPNIYGVYWRPSSDALIVTLRVQQPRGTERQVELVLDREHAADLASRILELVPVAAPVVPPAHQEPTLDELIAQLKRDFGIQPEHKQATMDCLIIGLQEHAKRRACGGSDVRNTRRSRRW